MKTQHRKNKTVDARPWPARKGHGPISRLLIWALICLVCLLVSDASSATQSAQYKEYEVKAAFIFNFLKFVDWPEEKIAKSNNQIIIGIVGEDPFGPAADIFKDKKVDERNLVVKHFEGLRQLKEMAEKDKNQGTEALKMCHILFVCPSEQKLVREIIELVGQKGVLTVGDTGGFVESGGVINFFLEDNKIRFDINLSAAEKAGLKIRSQLLRLARKVVTDKDAPTENNEASSSKEGK